MNLHVSSPIAQTKAPPASNHVLLHACCGPCSIMPVQHLLNENFGVRAYFFNPNIHPQDEYALRLAAMRQTAAMLNIPLTVEGESVLPEAWVQNLNGETGEGKRCLLCYRERLLKTAFLTKQLGFSAFTTSLLYSRYQHHESIIREAEQAARQAGVHFLYRDFRPYWQQGIEASKVMGLYRQKWCGCILSKKEAQIQREQRQKLKEARKAAAMPVGEQGSQSVKTTILPNATQHGRTT